MIRKILFLILFTSTVVYPGDFFKGDSLKPDSLKQDEEIKDEWLARDKGQHLAGSFFSTGFIIMAGNNFLNFKKEKSRTIGISFTFTLAVGKELYDNQQSDNHFSFKDLTADLLGIGLAVLVFQ